MAFYISIGKKGISYICSTACTMNNQRYYLKDMNKIFDDDPVIIVNFIPSQFQNLVSSDLVYSFPVCKSETHHVIGQVPLGYKLIGDEPLLEVEFQAGAVPCRKDNCC